ncbi:MAG: sigma 54-interacting transcriptional regulator [Clostridium sp.]|uniref:sigma 54-interacting transcriptional regulator n=1 Tax=Clostridium TaxID=1485 RepID=UPI0018989AFB|nr:MULTISPECIES: sigma 54-interacting transcriptional regulator [Clostridium]MDU5211016.1 sigma 54-interacting transcriptional regulator [Clostridium sp.]MDU6762910.1 sigma 54-interacting transcriptional regulator [Clostridium sp.]
MKRIERILDRLERLSYTITKEDILKNRTIGFTANEVGSELGVVRNNAASDLNELVKLGFALKITGKPVRFLSRKEIERIIGNKINGHIFNAPKELLELENKTSYQMSNKKIRKKDCFIDLVGYNKSLKMCVNQGKAAVCYPPHGLNTLIVGETGVGKSLFAEKMFEYGKSEGVFCEDSKFVTFNCADYANNPQLLLAEIFGSKKGAYTGALEDRKGVLEEADGGVLFLDEIHRLPPEGQEMLFFFMDKEKYRRLGESKNDRNARVMIIGATTEGIESSLLRTFTRRIPVSISIPPLRERSIKERLSILKTLFSLESKRIGQKICVHKDVMTSLLIYKPTGNIGQLRSDIQITVARAFLEYRSNYKDFIEVIVDFLPSYVRDSCLEVDENLRYKIDRLAYDNYFEYSGSEKSNLDIEVPKYDFEKYFNDLRKKINSDSINLTKVYDDFTQAVVKDMYSNYKYANIINDEIIEIVSTISEIVYEDLQLVFDKEVYYSLAFHFKNISEFNYIEPLNEEYKHYIKIINSKEFSVAIKVVKRIEKEFNIKCSKYEPYLLATIFFVLSSNKKHDFIDIIVIAHGDLIAEKLAETANLLLGIDHIKYINMPLTMKPEIVLDEALEMVKSSKNNKGTLIMVDMGSLVFIGEKIQERTGLKVKVIENTNILSLIEASRRAIMPNANIDEIMYSLVKLQKNLYEKQKRRLDEEMGNSKKVIFTICNTGQGTATYIEESIKKILKKNNIYDINVIPISVSNKKEAERIIDLAIHEEKKYIIAIVGAVEFIYNNIPYISLQEMLTYSGIKKLVNLIDEKINIENDESLIIDVNRDMVLGAAADVTSKYLQCLDVEKVHPYLVDFISCIEHSNIFKLALNEIASTYVHVCCMIERILLCNNILKSDENLEEVKAKLFTEFNFIKRALRNIEVGFSIEIPDDEIYYLLLIFIEKKQCT